jgi:hypothetical protein
VAGFLSAAMLEWAGPHAALVVCAAVAAAAALPGGIAERGIRSGVVDAEAGAGP